MVWCTVIKHYDDWWTGLEPCEIVYLAIGPDRKSLPIRVLMDALRSVLGRPVFTHEMAFPDLLLQEMSGTRETPTFDEVVDLIPAEKRFVIVTGDDQ